MDDRRWQDLEMDCLVKVFEKVGMESVLLDVPFVCKSWYKATLNPSCWQCLIFPDDERTEVWPWDDFECPDFQNLMDRFASEFQIDGDRFSVTTFLKFVINRSSGTAVLLKLPKCCTVETFEFAANVYIKSLLQMDERRWGDLEMDCLVKVFEKVGMESLLLDVPFVCKSWYKATLNPSCWQSLIFPDNECIEVWPWDVPECPNFQNLMDRFASEYQIDGDRCSVTAFLKFVINRSNENATVLKLPKCCTVEAFEFAANVCPGLVTLSLPVDVLDSEHTNLELIGKCKNLEVLSLGSSLNLAKILAIIQTHCKNFYGLDLSKGFVHGREALSIVKLVPNIKYLNLKGAKVRRDSLVTLLCGCKDLVMLDARDCFGFDENDDEISKLASHISKFMCEGSEFPLRDMYTPVYGYSFQQNVEENWDEMLNDLCDAFNDLSDEE